jgi:hypothetical protein
MKKGVVVFGNYNPATVEKTCLALEQARAAARVLGTAGDWGRVVLADYMSYDTQLVHLLAQEGIDLVGAFSEAAAVALKKTYDDSATALISGLPLRLLEQFDRERWCELPVVLSLHGENRNVQREFAALIHPNYLVIDVKQAERLTVSTADGEGVIVWDEDSAEKAGRALSGLATQAVLIAMEPGSIYVFWPNKMAGQMFRGPAPLKTAKSFCTFCGALAAALSGGSLLLDSVRFGLSEIQDRQPA